MNIEQLAFLMERLYRRTRDNKLKWKPSAGGSASRSYSTTIENWEIGFLWSSDGQSLVEVVDRSEPPISLIAARENAIGPHKLWREVRSLVTLLRQRSAQEEGGLAPLLVHLDQLEDQE